MWRAHLKSLRAPLSPTIFSVRVLWHSIQGLLRYLEKMIPEKLQSRGVLIGYDGRHNSRRFAEISAAVFLSRNIRVYLCDEMVPTPIVVSFRACDQVCVGITTVRIVNVGAQWQTNGEIFLKKPQNAAMARSCHNSFYRPACFDSRACRWTSDRRKKNWPSGWGGVVSDFAVLGGVLFFASFHLGEYSVGECILKLLKPLCWIRTVHPVLSPFLWKLF